MWFTMPFYTKIYAKKCDVNNIDWLKKNQNK